MYITPEDIMAFIGPDCDEGTACSLAEMSESLFNGYINDEAGLIESSRTQHFRERDFSRPDKVGKVFWLSYYNPTAITSINGVSAGVVNIDYTLEGKRLEKQFGVDRPVNFPYRWAVVYTAGIPESEIPEDVKMACKYIAKGLFGKVKSMDITSFRQDLLQVNFNVGKQFLDLLGDDKEVTFLDKVIGKYRNACTYAI